MFEPFISIITPVYNSASVIGECLEAIASQDYPKDRMEIIMPDGGSTDDTVKVIETFKDRLNITVCDNPLKTGEAGKAAGIDRAKGEIVALIDSDNIMPAGYIRNMLRPFENEPDIMGAEPLHFCFREKDKPLTRYFAMSGVNDPLCLFIGNYDKYSYITGKWTGFKLRTEWKDGYFVIELDEKKIPTIGANGTFLKREHLMKADYSPYMFDIDVVYEILKAGVPKFAKVDTGIVHIYSPDMASFIKKQSRRIKDFMFFAKEKKRTYPWAKLPAAGIAVFVLYCVTVIPLLIQSLIAFARKPRWEWVFHPAVCWVTLLIYGVNFLKAGFSGKTEMKDRKNW